MKGTILLIALLSPAPSHAADGLLVNGIVSDVKSGKPIPGAQVSAAGDQAQKSVTTDVHGVFVLPLRRDIQLGDIIQLHIEKNGYDVYEENVPVAPRLPRPILLVPLSKRSPTKSPGPSSTQPATVTVNAYLQPGPHPDGFAFAGIVWQAAFSDVRLDISVQKAPIHDLDFLLSLDTTIMAVGQVSQFPGCTFFPPEASISGFTLEGKDVHGKEISIPVDPTPGNINASPVYRIHCEEVFANVILRLAIAAKALNPSPDGTLPKQLFAPNRDPRLVRIDGKYKSGGSPRPLHFSGSISAHPESVSQSPPQQPPGTVYPDPGELAGTESQFNAQEKLDSASNDQLRAMTANIAKQMRQFHVQYDKYDRPEIDVNNDDPASVQAYRVEMQRRIKEDEQRERQYTNDFAQQFSDAYRLCKEIASRCEARGIAIDANSACLEFANSTPRPQALDRADSITRIAHKCLD